MENKIVKTQKLSFGARALDFFLKPEIGVLIPILILCVITTILKPNFLTWKYFSGIFMGCIFIGVEAIGQGFVQITGGVDLSVGMCGCLSGIMMGVACGWWGWGLVPCLLMALVTGMVVGIVNGICVCKLKLDAWITTLATQFICRGLAVTISEGMPMSIKALNTSAFNRARPLGLSWMFFIFLALLIICDIVVRKTRFGFKLRAVGGNQNAAIMGGINANAVKMAAFVLCSVFGAIGGIFDVINKASANSTFGDGREFRTIICVAIGGISAGSGSMLGVGFGVALFHILWYALRILSVDTNLQLVLIGALLVLSVILDIQRKKMEARRIAR